MSLPSLALAALGRVPTTAVLGAAAVLILMVPPGAEAQAPVHGDTVLTRLTAEALAANASLASERAMARAASARIPAAGALPDPTVTVGAMDLTLPRFAFHESDFTEVDVELSQEFPWPGTLGSRTRGAAADATMRSAGARARGREITVRTAMLYHRLRYVVAARATLLRQRALLTSSVEISTARYATGSVSQSDPLQARVARARLEAEAATLAAEEAGLRADLKALRNVRGPDSLVLEPIRPEAVRALATEADSLHEVMEGDSARLVDHPRLTARRAAIAAAEANARAEQLGGRPSFTFTTRYGARPLGADFVSAFVGVRLPLWAGRKQHRLVEATRIEAEAARAALADETATLQAELERTEADAEAGRVRLALLVDQVIPAAQATVDAALRGYRVGQVDFLNVLAVEDALYRAQLDAAAVAAEHLTHLVMLDQLLAQETDR